MIIIYENITDKKKKKQRKRSGQYNFKKKGCNQARAVLMLEKLSSAAETFKGLLYFFLIHWFCFVSQN